MFFIQQQVQVYNWQFAYKIIGLREREKKKQLSIYAQHTRKKKTIRWSHDIKPVQTQTNAFRTYPSFEKKKNFNPQTIYLHSSSDKMFQLKSKSKIVLQHMRHNICMSCNSFLGADKNWPFSTFFLSTFLTNHNEDRTQYWWILLKISQTNVIHFVIELVQSNQKNHTLFFSSMKQ